MSRFWSLPAPSGPYAVGTLSATLDPPTSKRIGRFDLTLWYPARPSSDRAPYGTGNGGLTSFIAQRLLRTPAARRAHVADGTARIPILLYTAGWGGVRTENTGLALDLASHGFLVVALDDVGRDSAAQSAVSGRLDLSSARAFRATLALAARKRDRSARRVSYVLDRLLASDGPLDRALRERLDPTRVGALGYSFGGAVALRAAQIDPRIRAVVNLDGWLFQTGSEPAHHPHVPYMLISTVDPPVTAADLASPDPVRRYTAELDESDWRVQLGELMQGGVLVAIAGTDHSSFFDDLHYAILHRSRRAISPSHVASIVGGYVVAFFKQQLKGESQPLLRTDAPHDGAVAFQSWPMMREPEQTRAQTSAADLSKSP